MNGGKIIITLDKYRKERGISKYKIIKNCDVSSTQLNSYCNNKVSRIDLPVIARICDYLECSISDILEYVPSGSEQDKGKDKKFKSKDNERSL